MSRRHTEYSKPVDVKEQKPMIYYARTADPFRPIVYDPTKEDVSVSTAPKSRITPKLGSGVTREGPQHQTKESETLAFIRPKERPQTQTLAEYEKEMIATGEISQKPQPSRAYSETEFTKFEFTPRIKRLSVMQKEKRKQENIIAGMVIGSIAMPFVAPIVLPASFGVTATGILLGQGLSIGASEGISLVTTGEHITFSEGVSSAFFGGALTIGTTSVLNKVVNPRIVRPYIDRTYYTGMEKAMNLGVRYRPSFSVRALQTITGVKPHLAKNIVSFTPPATTSFKGLQAESFAWELGTGPKSSLLSFNRPPPTPTISIIKDTPLTTGFSILPTAMKTLTYEQGRITFNRITEQFLVYQQPVKTAIPKIPYLPTFSIVGSASKSMLGSFAGLSSFAILSTAPQKLKVKKPTEVKRISKTFTSSILLQESDQEVIQNQILGIGQTQKQRTGLNVSAILGSKTVSTTQHAVSIGFNPLMQTTGKAPPPFTPPKIIRFDGSGKGLYAKWFGRKHKVKKWKDVLGEIKTKKKKKKKKRRGRSPFILM